MTDNDTTLPGDWQWATNIHDQAKGVAASKVWWHKNKPFIRVKLYAVPAVDGSEGAMRGSIEVALTEENPQWQNIPAGKKRKPRHTMKWEYVMDIPSLPAEPTAAAVCVELDAGSWMETIRSRSAQITWKNLLWCEREE